MTNSRHRKTKKPQGSKTVTTALKWVVLALILWFSWLNISPYVKLVQMLGNGAINANWGINFLIKAFIEGVMKIPVIGGIFYLLFNGSNIIFGFLVWFAVQFFEVLPILVFHDKDFLETYISEADGAGKYEERESDDAVLSLAKKSYNALPSYVVGNLLVARLIAYCIELFVCLWFYAPVKSGNILDFVKVIGMGQWNRLDYGNLWMTLVTMFAVEMGIRIWLWIKDLDLLMKQAKSA